MEETDIPDNFDFATMSFKKVESPFSDQHLEVEDRLETDEENDIRYTYDPTNQFGPQNWQRYFPQCGGNRQSPMDLSSCQNATKMSNLRLTEMNTRPVEITLTNNGHSSEFSLDSQFMNEN